MRDIPNVQRQVEQINVMGVAPALGADIDPALGQTVYYQDTLLTAAEINDMKDTNVEVVAAPPSGYAAVPIEVMMFLDHGGTDFVQGAATDQFALKYDGGSQIVELGLAATFETFIEASSDAHMFLNFAESALSATGALGFTPVVAKAIDLDNNGSTDNTTGNGVMYMRGSYILVPMSGAGFNNIAR